MMTTQEFNFLLAISEFGWSRAKYHWHYLWLYDSESDDINAPNLQASLLRKVQPCGFNKIRRNQNSNTNH